MTLSTVLVANRGEIAGRVFRACRELGLTSVAVYSDVDADSAWSRQADRGVHLPGVSPAETYLDIEAVLHAARETEADAVHPGYGFLSENAEFATACAEAGVTFVGPSPEAIRIMGSKVAAREAARSAGVPVIPGLDGAGRSPENLADAAAELGFPLLVKASAGGGGRGMRIVRAADELPDAVRAARAEAASAFGDDHILIERFFEHARHVEVQVLGDNEGNLLHLFERECSIQRRHQKIVEESPSPALDDETRDAMTAAALALAREVDYASAGTVEFLLDDESGQFYLLEMNTRLQVEHPVTELVTGVDIVGWQLRIAGGERLALAQDALEQRGHAIECRVYAEDPARGFAPATGDIVHYRAAAGPGVRVDAGVAEGGRVTPHYDAMLAKVITHGWDRAEARRRMALALRETVVLGLTTNVPYLQDIIAHPAYIAGETTTRFLEQHMAGWTNERAPTEEDWLAAAAFEALSSAARAESSERATGDGLVADPWAETEAWRNVR